MSDATRYRIVRFDDLQSFCMESCSLLFNPQLIDNMTPSLDFFKNPIMIEASSGSSLKKDK